MKNHTVVKFSFRVLIAVLAVSVTLPASASGSGHNNYFFAGPTGAWVLNVEFPATPGGPPPPPPFVETLTFHALGTLSESNTLLNENSYNPAFGQGCGFTGPGGSLELNCNGSEGTGSWRRTGRHSLSFVVVKLVYDGITNEQVGYLRVSGNLRFRKDKITQDAGESLTEFLIGKDIETAIAIPLGGANAEGIRIR